MKMIPTPFAFGLALLAAAGLAGPLSAQTTYQWTGATDGAWESAGNWTPNTLYPGNISGGGDFSTDVAEFTNASGLPTTVTLGGAVVVQLGQITFDAGASAYTIVTSSNSDTLNLMGTGLVNNSGVNQTLSGMGTVNFFNSASVGSNITLQNSGTGSGASVIYFTDSSSAGSATIVVGDQLQFRNTASAGTATITNNGNINFGETSTAASARIANSGGLYVMYHTGDLTIGEVSGAGSIYLGSNTLTLGGLNTDATISGPISGDGGLTKIGTGTQTLTGANTYTGTTTISAGTLQIGDGGVIAGDIVDSSALVFNRSDTATYAGAISGTGTVTKSGSGTLTLSGANTYSGGTTLAGGTLSLGSSGALGSTGTISFSGGTLQYSASNTTDYSSRFSTTASQAYALDTNGQNVTLASALTSSGGTLTKSGTGTLTLTGANTYSGTTTVSGGTLQLGNGGAAGSIAGDLANSSAVSFNRSDDTTYAGVISGTGSVTKTGSGALTLSGTSTYSGATTINAGRLIVDGSIANSAVTVGNGGILGGSGIVGALTIGSGGVLSPGNSPGLIQAGDTTFAGGGSFQWEIKDTSLILGTPTWDILNVTGGLSITANAGDRFTIDVTSLTTGNVSGDAFNFNSGTSYEIPFVQVAGGITGFDAAAFVVDTTHFTNAFTGTWSVGMSNDGQYLTVNYSAVPEPATSVALAGFAVLLIAGYRRRHSRRIAATAPRA